MAGGRYRLLGQLATGGMAEVHLAQALGIGGFQKLLVVKRLLPELAANPEHVDMFVDEARIAATLDHSNIVHVYDVGREDGFVYIAMEHLFGQDLRAILRKREGPLPLDVALGIVLGVCAGLHHAHEKRDAGGRPLGIVHRDVSPHNVIVTYDGGVKLIDFGIAKAAGRINATREGLLKGKFGYMSPEQCRCLPLDRRSDVFGVGILLWEATVGRRLYPGENEFDLVQTVVNVPAPPPSQVVPGYPPELDAIVRKSLAIDREARYPTARGLQLDLETFARGRGLGLSPHALARWMEARFADELAGWRAAEGDGLTLSEHLAPSAARAASPPDKVTVTASGEVAAGATEKRPSRRVLGAVVVGAVVLALGIFGFDRIPSSPTPAGAPARTAPVDAPTVSPAPPALAPASTPTPATAVTRATTATATPPAGPGRRRRRPKRAASTIERADPSPAPPRERDPDPDAPLPH